MGSSRPVVAIERRRDPSLAYGKDGVAQTRELGEIGGMDQRAAAAGHEVADEGMDLGLGRDVDALRGLVEQKHGDPPRQPFRQDHLLLIAARQRAGPKLRPPRTDVHELHQLGHDPIARAAIEPAHARERVEVGQ